MSTQQLALIASDIPRIPARLLLIIAVSQKYMCQLILQGILVFQVFYYSE